MSQQTEKQQRKEAERLFILWLNSRKNLGNQVGASPDYPAYGMSSSDAMKWMTAESPLDLYKDTMDPRAYLGFNYPTSALNVKSAPWSRFQKPEIAAFITEEDDPRAPFYTSRPERRGGIYAHELGHFQDTRPNPYKAWSFPNHGFTTYGGLSGGLLQREFPGMVAEEKYWMDQGKDF